jgi:hypothetical protein
MRCGEGYWRHHSHLDFVACCDNIIIAAPLRWQHLRGPASVVIFVFLVLAIANWRTARQRRLSKRGTPPPPSTNLWWGTEWRCWLLVYCVTERLSLCQSLLTVLTLSLSVSGPVCCTLFSRESLAAVLNFWWCLRQPLSVTLIQLSVVLYSCPSFNIALAVRQKGRRTLSRVVVFLSVFDERK